MLGKIGRLMMVLLATVVLCGCAVTGFSLRAHRISRYARRHPERPPEVLASLQRGEVASGMNTREVRLLLGAPHEQQRHGTDLPTGYSWQYYRPSQSRGGMDGSAMWALRIPFQRLDFGNDGILTNVMSYARPPVDAAAQPARAPAPAPATPPAQPSVAAPSPPVPRPGQESVASAPAPARAAAEPAYWATALAAAATPGIDTATWPALTLNGVITMGRQAGAVLNHTVVEVGESVEQVEVLGITAGGALLEFRGERLFLQTGSSTRSP